MTDRGERAIKLIGSEAHQLRGKRAHALVGVAVALLLVATCTRDSVAAVAWVLGR
jgi:hypothetical protein